VFQGLSACATRPGPEVPRAVATCREAEVKVIMVTGDHPATAVAIAAEIGLVRDGAAEVVTGERQRPLPDEALAALLDLPDILFARVGAPDKMRIVEALAAKGHVVAAPGDGVNDAPALKAAHIAVAMGRSGTDGAREAADMVLRNDGFASIVAAIEERRAVFQNIRKFLTYVPVHNVAELAPYLAFELFQVPLALTPIQILLVDMGTDSLTGLGLGVEPPDPADMRRPPRPQHEPLLTWPVAARAYLLPGPIEAAAGMAAFVVVLMQGGWSWGDDLAWHDRLYRRATTGCLSAIIVLQTVNVFLCRSASRSAFAPPAWRNLLILVGAAEILLLLAANYLPPANAVLRTLRVLGDVTLLLAPFALAMSGLDELAKILARRSGRRSARA
jgi:sodium/potassium-transporting ATPase subunit alpha